MSKCCGAQHSTPFCPVCGKQLAPRTGIAGLILYLATQSEEAEKRLNKFKKDVADCRAEGKDDYRWESRERRVQTNYNKWSGWLKAVQDCQQQMVKREEDV